MMSDIRIRNDVKAALLGEPSLRACPVRVLVTGAVVTLSGEVDSYIRKCIAVRTAWKVRGVTDVEEMLCVVIPPEDLLPDNTIAAMALLLLEWNDLVPDQGITVQVQNGMVKLEGEVDWDYQRAAAISAVSTMRGVKVVVNAINLCHRVQPTDAREHVLQAFERNVNIRSKNIAVKVTGNKITLSGTVGSYAEKEEAGHIAWQAPGITFAENRLTVHDPERNS